MRLDDRLDDRLAAVELPALVRVGAKDQLAAADLARDLADGMSDAKLAVIEDRVTSRTSISQMLWPRQSTNSCATSQ